MAGVAAWSVHAGVDWGSSLRLQETEAICAYAAALSARLVGHAEATSVGYARGILVHAAGMGAVRRPWRTAAWPSFMCSFIVMRRLRLI
eukprot:scaffold24253_cov65-Phaeocystis_antarctica.AAC.1